MKPVSSQPQLLDTLYQTDGSLRSHNLLSGEPDKVAVTDSYAASLP